MLVEIEKRAHLITRKSTLSLVIHYAMCKLQLHMALQPILVRTGNGSVTAQSEQLPRNIPIYDDLAQAVDTLLAD